MADDLNSSLESYYLQLQQVDAALTTDPSNPELVKLKTDLQEVIDLTKELAQQYAADLGESTALPSEIDEIEEYEKDPGDWKVGDKCLAPWCQDGKLYEAVIEEIQSDGKVSIGFTAYSHGDVTHVSLIKPVGSVINETVITVPTTKPKPSTVPVTSASGSSKRSNPKESLAERKAALLKQKEYLKKRKQKKITRVQQQEADREKDKKKWINFSTRKGLLNKKKSIFASPETVDGRVGIGTCGVAGKPMTEFSQADKWKRGWRK